MKINLNDFKINSLTLEEVNKIIQIFEDFKHNVLYFYSGQVANAKSLINLLAINICNMPFGYFEIKEDEDKENIEILNNFLKSLTTNS